MDLGFLASANSITNKYLNQLPANRFSQSVGLDDNLKKQFGSEFEAAYDSMTATKALSANLRQSYDYSHEVSFKEHASRLGYSIDNRIIDMLHLQLSDDMSSKVSSALNNAIESLV